MWVPKNAIWNVQCSFAMYRDKFIVLMERLRTHSIFSKLVFILTRKFQTCRRTAENAFYFFKISFHIDEKVSDMSKNGRECILFFLRTMLVYPDPIHALKRIHSSMFFSQIIKKCFLILIESFLIHPKKERTGKYVNS